MQFLLGFEELVQAFSACIVGSTASLASMATFCQARRREAVLSHFPAHVGSHLQAFFFCCFVFCASEFV